MERYIVHHWQFITQEFVPATGAMAEADAWSYVREQVAGGKDMGRFRVEIVTPIQTVEIPSGMTYEQFDAWLDTAFDNAAEWDADTTKWFGDIHEMSRGEAASHGRQDHGR